MRQLLANRQMLKWAANAQLLNPFDRLSIWHFGYLAFWLFEL
jgi:hypothetical protein